MGALIFFFDFGPGEQGATITGSWSLVLNVHGNADQITVHGNQDRVSVHGNQEGVKVC